MATFKVYRLHFTSPLHIGDRRDDYGISLKTISSDAMYAALTSCLAKIGETIPDDGDLGFTISSLFPYYKSCNKGDKPVYFFPKPLYQPMLTLNDDELPLMKKIKKVKWLDLECFEKNLSGNIFFDKTENIHKEYLTNKKIKDDFVYSQISQRVAISRLGTEDANPFYMERVFFKDNSGLFFIMQGDTSKLEKALSVLKDEGIGTDRNVGNGIFEYEPDTIDINIPESANHAMALSMFIPKDKVQLIEMLNDDKIAYEFERRGGWITSTNHNIRKNIIHAITQGSVVKMKCEGSQIHGKIVNLRPEVSFEQIEHPVWRNGKSIFIPIKL